jgi:hypothetical protein
MITDSLTLFSSAEPSGKNEWYITDDVVMGGRSNGKFYINDQGHAVFEGFVSLENNGGFSMVRKRVNPIEVKRYRKVSFRLKGDGKRYQLRVKTDVRDRHSYVQYFQTDDGWQVIEIELDRLYPAYRGRTLDKPNYPAHSLSEIGFLIGNKAEEQFKLEIDWIRLVE